SSIKTPRSPTTDTMVSMTDQERIVSRMVNPKNSLNIQNPGSLTWENMRLPAPVASTINSGLVFVDVINGSAIPAVVRPATVADPNDTRIAAAIPHTNSNGENVSRVAQPDM